MSGVQGAKINASKDSELGNKLGPEPRVSTRGRFRFFSLQKPQEGTSEASWVGRVRREQMEWGALERLILGLEVFPREPSSLNP